MKTIIWLLIIIAWSVLQARRKAIRERERQQRLAGQTDIPKLTRQQSYEDEPAESGIPLELEAIMNYAKSRIRPEENMRSVEWVESVPYEPETLATLPQAPSSLEFYEQAEEKPATENLIQTDPKSLRTFFVMREVLGPPRARKRFHARLKAQE